MLQAGKRKKIKATIFVVSLLCVLSIGVAVAAAYLNTNRDTRQAPERAKSDLKITNDYQLLYETDNYQYYFREDRDIIAVKEKNTGYIWKTGLDVPFKNQVSDAKDAVEAVKADKTSNAIKDLAEENDMTEKQVRKLAEYPVEDSLNDMYTAFANSLISIDFHSGTGKSMTTSKISSGASKKREGTSSIEKVEDNGSKWVLKCVFSVNDEDLGINVYITFGDDGSINYNVPNKEITGKGSDVLADIVIAPFMGASGGLEKYYNEKTKDWDKEKLKELTPGYILVPDGSGSLIRFTENKAKFSDYTGDVYGQDPATNTYYYQALDDAIPIEDPVMPVFGISQGDGTQSAFVAYADKGDEYMSIIATPSSSEKNEIKYSFAYAKFTYNSQFYQVTNQAGDSYRKIQDTPEKFDIDITYKFLYGDGSGNTPAADYTGMAKTYRQHLIDDGILKEKTMDGTNIPIRVDFLMSDSKKGVFSTKEVDVTTSSDVKSMINELLKDGVKNINSGLIGWQSGGQTLSKPYKASFSDSIGTKSDFEDLMSEFSKKNIDISFSRDFTTINKTMMGYYGNAAKHMNTQYLTLDKSSVLPTNVPVISYGYATPENTAEWIGELYDSLGDLSKSFTITGASNVLVSTHESNGDDTSVSKAISLYQKQLENINKKGTKINLENPNKYLWKYTDRYLQSSVGTSQYVYETDSVPFLQMVLNGTMEVYAPYSNFSFYSQSDMLKMVDYNISPSFLLTKQPSYLLAATTSADDYSTEFSQYKELVGTVYSTVNAPLSQVINYNWDSRTVLQDGVIANQYSKDDSKKTIIINYTDDEITVKGTKIAAKSAAVLEGGVK